MRIVIKDDWRIRNQAKYLKGREFVYAKYEALNSHWEHEHCEFCILKISEGEYAYCTTDEYYWVCKSCFNDFKDSFAFSVKSDS